MRISIVDPGLKGEISRIRRRQATFSGCHQAIAYFEPNRTPLLVSRPQVGITICMVALHSSMHGFGPRCQIKKICHRWSRFQLFSNYKGQVRFFNHTMGLVSHHPKRGKPASPKQYDSDKGTHEMQFDRSAANV